MGEETLFCLLTLACSALDSPENPAQCAVSAMAWTLIRILFKPSLFLTLRECRYREARVNRHGFHQWPPVLSMTGLCFPVKFPKAVDVTPEGLE
ncbi:MAG: hypothetical protein WCI85_05455 [Comamonadaceae bacterium]